MNKLWGIRTSFMKSGKRYLLLYVEQEGCYYRAAPCRTLRDAQEIINQDPAAYWLLRCEIVRCWDRKLSRGRAPIAWRSLEAATKIHPEP